MEKTDEATVLADDENSTVETPVAPESPVPSSGAIDMKSEKKETPEFVSPLAKEKPKNDVTPAPAAAPSPVHVPAPTPAPTATFSSLSASSPPKSSGTISAEYALNEVGRWIKAGNKLSHVDNETLQVILKEHEALKDKTGKLKSLLGRSAKAQRENKIDLDVTVKRLDVALREIDKLNKKIDKLANRPTHMELLADFETNFDRAMLSVGQTGGQDTASVTQPASSSLELESSGAVVDTLLMQELAESKQRIEKLEGLNSALGQRSTQLENEAKERKRERDDLANKVSHLELEKRMAVMEAEHATKAMQEKAASLAEMQMEIDLVTRASRSANMRAAQGEEMAKTVKTDRQHVLQLESQVEALQEWALASAEAKTLAQERVRLLESQLQYLKQETLSSSATPGERILFTKSASIVVGAGDIGVRVLQLDEDQLKGLKRSDRVVLRWQFDMKSEDLDIRFSVLKGACDTVAKRKNADYLIQDRAVKGGAGGETENAFAVQNASTLLWSNVKSWIKPKTIRYNLEVVVVND
jgi:hypothetical protein